MAFFFGRAGVGWAMNGVMEVMAGSGREIDVVCGVILDGEGRCLACRRPEGKHLGGLWEFPGGKVDAGEMPDAALVRELEEELGIRVEVGERLRDVRWDYARSWSG